MGWMARVWARPWACLGGCTPILLNYDEGGDQPAMCAPMTHPCSTNVLITGVIVK